MQSRRPDELSPFRHHVGARALAFVTAHLAGQPGIGTEPRPPARHAAAGFIGNTSITLVGLGAGAMLTMVNEVLAAHFLGIASYGLYGLAMLLAKLGEKIAVFGVPVSVLRYLPVHLNRGERGEALGTVLGGIPLSICLGITLLLALGMGSGWLAVHAFGQSEAEPWIAVLAVAVPMLALIDLLGDVTRGFGRALPAIVFRNLAPQLCLMSVLVWLLLAGGPQLGVAYGQLGGLAVGLALASVAVLRLVRSQIGWVRPILRIRQLYGYALPIALNSLVSLAMGGTDLFLLSVFSDADAVGAYRGCMQIVLVFDLIWNAFAAATATVYTVLIADGDRARLQATYAAASHMGMLLAAPLLLVIAFNASDILGLLGSAFTAGAAALTVLALGQFIKVALGAASIMLNVGGRQTLEAGNVALAAGLNLALNLALIPRYGLLGASLSTATSLTALSLLRCFQLKRVFGLMTSGKALARVLLATAAPAATVWLASLALGWGPGSGLLPLAMRLVAMAACFCVSLWTLCLTSHDREMLRRPFRRQ